MDYRVALDIYKGPLDLLLYLIRENELDIYDIPIAVITDQYMQHLELIRLLDPNLAGDFLVMASTLMEIKSRMLLPRAETEAEEEDEGDPRIELIRQLMEYKKFKEAAAALAERREEQLDRFGRGTRQTFDEPADDEALEISEVSIWDILSAFDRVMRETLRLQPATIRDRDVPVRQHIESILAMLREHGVIRFVQIFEQCEDRVEAIGAFLALLEMARSRVITLEQGDGHGMITIQLVSEENVERLLRELSEAASARDMSSEEETAAAAHEEPVSTADEETGEETQPQEEAEPIGEGEQGEEEMEEEEEEDAELDEIRHIEIRDVVLARETEPAETPSEEQQGGEEPPEPLIDDEKVAGLRTSDVPLPETDNEPLPETNDDTGEPHPEEPA